MASIQRFWYSKKSVDRSGDIENQTLRTTLKVITTERVAWEFIEKQSFFPKYESEHWEERGFFLNNWKPVTSQGRVWEIELEFLPIKFGQPDPNPLNRPAVITFETSLVEQPTNWDTNRKPIVTTAGEFITGVMQKIPIVDYSVSKNLAADPKWLQTHLGAVNSDEVRLRGLLWKPKTLLLASVSGGDFTTENRTTFAPFGLKIMADVRGWTQEVWNRGTVELKKVWKKVDDPSTKSGVAYKHVWTQVPIEAGDPPERVTDPVPIDINGRAVPDYLQKNDKEPLKPDSLISLNFETQRALPFLGVLPLK